jgi:hypothetical protein
MLGGPRGKVLSTSSYVLCNRQSGVFDHFGNVFNMKFRLLAYNKCLNFSIVLAPPLTMLCISSGKYILISELIKRVNTNYILNYKGMNPS